MSEEEKSGASESESSSAGSPIFSGQRVSKGKRRERDFGSGDDE